MLVRKYKEYGYGDKMKHWMNIVRQIKFGKM